MFPTADTPATTDDAATRMIAANLAAARLYSPAMDVGPSLSCTDVDALAVLLAAHGQRDAALSWIASHMVSSDESEDEGDSHYRPDLATDEATHADITAAAADYLDGITLADLTN